MENRIKKISLPKIFTYYLFSVGISVFLIIIFCFLILISMIKTEIVLPANTAEYYSSSWVELLESGTNNVKDLPLCYRWISFDGDRQNEKKEGLSKIREKQIIDAYKNKLTVTPGFPKQFYSYATMPDSTVCVIQYDFSMIYTVNWMQKILPDFQLLLVIIALILIILTIIFITKRFTKILKHDADKLNNTVSTILSKKLDTPFENNTKVAEFSHTLQAMDFLRENLSDSLNKQWKMEQQRMNEISSLAHDLKTPLTVINGNAELLEEDNLNDSQKENLNAIIRNAQRMESYINKLRYITKLNLLDNEDSAQETVKVITLINEWNHMGQDLCSIKNIEFTIKHNFENKDNTIKVEVQNINRAIFNIIDNAVRFSPENGKIEVTVKVLDTKMIVEVQDSGSGFSSNALQHSFDMFYTENESRTSSDHMGLGLFNVRKIAERHHGKVSIHNTDKGALVKFLIRI